jgi:hypothetical protein
MNVTPFLQLKRHAEGLQKSRVRSERVRSVRVRSERVSQERKEEGGASGAKGKGDRGCVLHVRRVGKSGQGL